MFLLELPTRGRSGVEVGAQRVAGLDRGGQLITQGTDVGAQRLGILRERLVHGRQGPERGTEGVGFAGKCRVPFRARLDVERELRVVGPREIQGVAAEEREFGLHLVERALGLRVVCLNSISVGGTQAQPLEFGRRAIQFLAQGTVVLPRRRQLATQRLRRRFRDGGPPSPRLQLLACRLEGAREASGLLARLVQARTDQCDVRQRLIEFTSGSGKRGVLQQRGMPGVAGGDLLVRGRELRARCRQRSLGLLLGRPRRLQLAFEVAGHRLHLDQTALDVGAGAQRVFQRIAQAIELAVRLIQRVALLFDSRGRGLESRDLLPHVQQRGLLARVGVRHRAQLPEFRGRLGEAEPCGIALPHRRVRLVPQGLDLALEFLARVRGLLQSCGRLRQVEANAVAIAGGRLRLALQGLQWGGEFLADARRLVQSGGEINEVRARRISFAGRSCCPSLDGDQPRLQVASRTRGVLELSLPAFGRRERVTQARGLLFGLAGAFHHRFAIVGEAQQFGVLLAQGLFEQRTRDFVLPLHGRPVELQEQLAFELRLHRVPGGARHLALDVERLQAGLRVQPRRALHLEFQPQRLERDDLRGLGFRLLRESVERDLDLGLGVCRHGRAGRRHVDGRESHDAEGGGRVPIAPQGYRAEVDARADRRCHARRSAPVQASLRRTASRTS